MNAVDYLAVRKDNVLRHPEKSEVLTNPVKFIGDTKVSKVECAIMELSTPDESGRRRPIESNKDHIFLKADLVLLALGSKVDYDIFKNYNIDLDKWNSVNVDNNNQTNINGVYAGGDVVTGPLTVVSAMKAGINAAKDILNK